ncbi:hypothetical protein CMO83_00235 [Candidatus Woesearchaeota archaeon]|jgi:predicted RNA-binding Zn-ribbon protein involved in translation (DUF1610 family)|nr:hypothetical protein [Candidatus Woesearchaeota archaeon]MDP6648492.1 hypothetical protein [Candidatus Woesearchaeota archaeon]|tara:strand:- start:2529 stop:2936 length:408 start_codon:yes stop_codon:yes gene_type:complete
MALKKPNSMEECVYFTNRTIDSGRAMAWVFKKSCPKCKEGLLCKPAKKDGKPDKKADHFDCNKCGHSESNEDVEKDLIVNVDYKCPYCGNEGEAQTEYIRKSFKGAKAFVFACGKCSQKIGITKKLKEIKKKEKK